MYRKAEERFPLLFPYPDINIFWNRRNHRLRDFHRMPVSLREDVQRLLK